jgi:hypothetical protein
MKHATRKNPANTRASLRAALPAFHLNALAGWLTQHFF